MCEAGVAEVAQSLLRVGIVQLRKSEKLLSWLDVLVPRCLPVPFSSVSWEPAGATRILHRVLACNSGVTRRGCVHNGCHTFGVNIVIQFDHLSCNTSGATCGWLAAQECFLYQLLALRAVFDCTTLPSTSSSLSRMISKPHTSYLQLRLSFKYDALLCSELDRSTLAQTTRLLCFCTLFRKTIFVGRGFQLMLFTDYVTGKRGAVAASFFEVGRL
eukprot:g6729.t1